MQVELGQARGQSPHDSGDPLGGHRPGPGQAKHLVGDRDARPPEPRPDHPGPGLGHEGRRQVRPGLDGGQDSARFDRCAAGGHTVAAADPQHQTGDGGMQVIVLVGVHMVQRQAGAGEGFELGLDLGGQLAADAGPEEDLGAQRRKVGAEQPLARHQVRQLGWRQHRPAFDQHEVKPHAQPRRPLGPRHGVVTARSGDHQAGRRQDTVAMADLDRLIDLFRRAEVVGGDDQPPGQETIMSSRVRRNWKNSTPSRSLRTSMSREVSISPTISAIFDGRK